MRHSFLWGRISHFATRSARGEIILDMLTRCGDGENIIALSYSTRDAIIFRLPRLFCGPVLIDASPTVYYTDLKDGAY
jgi:hypothetical protein